MFGKCVLVCVLLTVSLAQVSMPIRVKFAASGIVRDMIPQTAFTKKLNSSILILTISLYIEGLAYDLTVDTGSNQLFIKGFNMPGAPVYKYQCFECVATEDSAPMNYLDGAVFAYPWKVQVNLSSTISLDMRAIIAFRATSKNFDQIGGILGLGVRENSQRIENSFIEELTKSGIVQRKVFAVKLNFKKDGQSYITFGAADPRFWNNSEKVHYYQWNINYNITIQGVDIGDALSLTISEVLFDTGNTCITFPKKFEQSITNAFNKYGNQCFFETLDARNLFKELMCLTADLYTFPSLKIRIGSESYEIGPEYYILRCRGLDKLPNMAGNKKYKYFCQTLIQSAQTPNYLLLGATFFLKYYGIFDLDNKTIGLVRNNDQSHINQIMRESDW